VSGSASASIDAKRVVIVGGGFAGLAAAKGLAERPGVRVTLIDRRNHHLFQPLLYQVAMAGLSPAEIAAPIRALLRGAENVEVRQEEAVGADLARRVLRTSAVGAPAPSAASASTRTTTWCWRAARGTPTSGATSGRSSRRG
jgi:NADH dehydrogenase FAD-containing subunit